MWEGRPITEDDMLKGWEEEEDRLGDLFLLPPRVPGTEAEEENLTLPPLSLPGLRGFFLPGESERPRSKGLRLGFSGSFSGVGACSSTLGRASVVGSDFSFASDPFPASGGATTASSSCLVGAGGGTGDASRISLSGEETAESTGVGGDLVGGTAVAVILTSSSASLGVLVPNLNPAPPRSSGLPPTRVFLLTGRTMAVGGGAAAASSSSSSSGGGGNGAAAAAAGATVEVTFHGCGARSRRESATGERGTKMR